MTASGGLRERLQSTAEPLGDSKKKQNAPLEKMLWQEAKKTEGMWTMAVGLGIQTKKKNEENFMDRFNDPDK